MGEETKQEQPPAEAQPEEKPAEDKKEEPPAPPPPPPPFVLFVDLHCVGCAKKIEKSIMKIRGVEGVVIDMAQNQVTIKGIIEPQAVCAKIMKKTKRRAKVLSPLPAAEGEPIPEVVASQVSGLATVELNVDMHCQACAEQLKRKILKMRGVQSAVTEHSTGKAIVTGTIDANKLVDYVYRRTKKQARIVPQPEPEPEPEPQPEPEKQEEKKEEEEKPAEEAKPEENAEKKEEENPPEETDKKEGGETENKEEEKKEEEGKNMNNEEESMKRMVYYYQPLYVIERMPPAPQLFSDENPNACCIS
ncbi:HEAVY METAL ASSOCIATED PROTEIN 47 [Hibiscus trionum]|uniref:HEAVY METAL ASSOCIATED PROTEIN 47 n=1 Tax=Hibiscus trionum TaxID=183268 RepID=A0A9W7MQ57_HIBTR|nr:HEAVY METAL ASSOCIATED PROTEIN 47 [Hibiscus trionum]